MFTYTYLLLKTKAYKCDAKYIVLISTHEQSDRERGSSDLVNSIIFSICLNFTHLSSYQGRDKKRQRGHIVAKI